MNDAESKTRLSCAVADAAMAMMISKQISSLVFIGVLEPQITQIVSLDPGSWWLRHSGAEIKTRVRWLVIGDVLPRNAQTILRIVHQCIKPMFGRYHGGVDM